MLLESKDIRGSFLLRKKSPRDTILIGRRKKYYGNMAKQVLVELTDWCDEKSGRAPKQIWCKNAHTIRNKVLRGNREQEKTGNKRNRSGTENKRSREETGKLRSREIWKEHNNTRTRE